MVGELRRLDDASFSSGAPGDQPETCRRKYRSAAFLGHWSETLSVHLLGTATYSVRVHSFPWQSCSAFFVPNIVEGNWRRVSTSTLNCYQKG